ncbi:Mn transporter [Candidatus Wirthbacteria bacterium CG2_30_54_11]|uniref:Mn transporter n=1 Tax=Candidatus Wirthbacteria bacterium CG2_30_54_11 TaxID=1817892 RepID=A0A1J5IMA6_9BACT|nr:MAG: Mn transporter [Candidatus Wirthbacteria bacterium CG2_30_54_11]
MKLPFKFSFRRLLLVLAVLGPGIISANADNDAAGITTYTVTGARYGYKLLFSLLIITIVLAITQELGARIGVISGKGLGGVIREKFGLKLTMLAMGAMLIANFGVIVADMAGVAEAMSLFGVTKYLSVPIFTVLLWLVLYKGSFAKAEKFFLVLSAMYIVYIVTAFYTKPDWGLALSSLVTPHIQFDKAYLVTLMALIGTTVTPWGQFFIQSYIVDKSTPAGHYGFQRLEIFFGAFLTDFISFFIIVTATNTLFKNGIFVNNASEAALSLAPLAGAQATSLFAFGLLVAGLLGVSIVTLATAYALCETFGFESAMDRSWKDAPVFYSLITFFLVIASLIVIIPGIPLFPIMISSQVINGLILPIILVYVYKIINDRKIMGAYTNGKTANFFALSAVGLLTIASLVVALTSIFT